MIIQYKLIVRILRIICFAIVFLVGPVKESKATSAELIHTSTEILVDKGKMVTTKVFDLLINDRSADYLSRIRVPYSRMEKLVSLEASLHNSDGSFIRKLNRDEIVSQSDISDYSLFEDQYVKVFTLRNSSYPYRIKWSYTLETSAFVNICNWIPVIKSEIPTRRATLSFISPESYQIRVDSAGIRSCTYRRNKNLLVREYECSFTGNYKQEVSQFDDTEHMPFVRIMPLQFHYVTSGRADTWKSFGVWISMLNKGLDELPENEKSLVSSMKRESLTETDLVRKLYNYVQDRTRYVNVSLETGGMKPYPATYVSNNAYGDCKALSIYLKALLSEAGIHSSYTLVRAGGFIRDIKTSFVSNQFNHAILLVPLDGDSIWLDATSDNPFGYAGSFIQGRSALVITDQGGVLARIPALTKEQVVLKRKGVVRLMAGLPASIELTIETGGENAEYLRSVALNIEDAERMKIIEKIIKVPSFVPDSITPLMNDRHKQRMALSYTGKSNSLLKSYGNELICPVIAVELSNFELPEERVTSLNFPYPTCLSDSLEFNVPPGYKIDIVPEPKEVVTEFGSYRLSYTSTVGSVIFRRDFYLNTMTFSREAYKGFYSFIKQIRKIEASSALSFTKI